MYAKNYQFSLRCFTYVLILPSTRRTINLSDEISKIKAIMFTGLAFLDHAVQEARAEKDFYYVHHLLGAGGIKQSG